MGEELRIIWLLAVGLGLACILGYTAKKAHQSYITGYLLAGYLIGPNSPGFVADTYISQQLASIGVTLLMFTVGLSFNWKDLIAVKKIALPGALILSSFSTIAGMFYSVYLGESLISGLVIGLAICVSSTVVIVRVLSDQGILHTPQGHIVVGWTIVEDLISVLGLLILPTLAALSFETGGKLLDIVSPILWVLLKIVLLGLFVYSVGEKFIEKILKTIARTRSHELFTLAILAITFLIAIGSSFLFGVSLALGAFIAGTVVGKTDMSHQAAANALPMRDVFAVIFFLSVGMLFNPIAVTHNLALFLGVLFILLVLRPILAFLIVRLAKYQKSVALTVALAVSQIGEYSFIFAEEGSNLGILPDNGYDILVAGAFITIGLNPILSQISTSYSKRAKTLKRRSESQDQDELSIELLSEPKYHKSAFLPRAVVIGFGPIGQQSAHFLVKKGYNVLVIDQNIDTISALKRSGEIEMIFGDASQFEILERAQIENARLLVITTPDFSTTQAIIQTARNINPLIQIVARHRFKDDLKHRDLAGVSTICDEDASAEKLLSAIQAMLKQ